MKIPVSVSNNIVSHGEMENHDRFKRTIKERRQFGNKKPEELESESDNSDADNSSPTLPFTVLIELDDQKLSSRDMASIKSTASYIS